MASRPSPRLGDLIEIHRFGYSHWAIYVGDGYVVHLAPPSEYAGAGSSSIMSALTDRAVVKKELLSTVAGRGKYQVNNKYDDRYPRLPITKIVKQALELVGKEIRYSVTSRNCEHFVTELRYGVPCSDQVAEVATNVVVGAGVVAGALGVIGLVLSRSKRERQ